MPTQVASTLSSILLAIRQRLLDKGTWNSDNLSLSLVKEPKIHFNGTQHCAIMPMVQDVIQDQVLGGGRYQSGVTGQIHVYIYSRLSLDMPQRDNDWLTDQTLGLLGAMHGTIDALQLFHPLDSQGNALLEEPMRLLKQDMPIKYLTMGDWGYLCLVFEIKYMLSLDTSIDV